MPTDNDSDEIRVQAVADGIRQMLDGPTSEEDLHQAVEAAMGDEEAGATEIEPPDDVADDRGLRHQPS